MAKASELTFGPVPSRRLGRSLGINNIPPKTCTYSCIYCQVGRTTRLSGDRRIFYEPEEIVQAVHSRIARARELNEQIDYLTFVPDGEPTLDQNLGREIDLLKQFGLPVAVITNSSLLWKDDVRDDLSRADWVSIKTDCFRPQTWRLINRPHKTLQLSIILDGLTAFAGSYRGTLVSETMIVRGVNDNEYCMREVADVLADLHLQVAYLSVPTRPPAEPWSVTPDEQTIIRVYQTLSAKVPRVELLIAYEGDAFISTGHLDTDLLAIAAVHPLREEAVTAMIHKAGSGWEPVDHLLEQGLLIKTEYKGHIYYLRHFSGVRRA